MSSLATAALTLSAPIAWEEVRSMRMSRTRMEIEGLGLHFAPEDLPALNAALAAAPAPLPPESALAREDFELIVSDARRRAVAAAMHTVARALLASGVTRGAPVDPAAPTPDPTAWPDGFTFHRTVETVLGEIVDYAALVAAVTEAGRTPPTTLPELGRLFTEQEMASMFAVSLQVLRQWRGRSLHFEWIKWPGRRGTVRYTERGVIAFCRHHLRLVDQAPAAAPLPTVPDPDVDPVTGEVTG